MNMNAQSLLSIIAIAFAVLLHACCCQEDTNSYCGDPNRVQLSNSR